VIGANWVSTLPERLVDVRKAQKVIAPSMTPTKPCKAPEALRWDTFSSWGSTASFGSYLHFGAGAEVPSDGLLWVGSVAAGGAAVEQSYDKDGIIWPVAIAPYHVIITIPNLADAQQIEAAEQLYTQLNSSGIETLLDDRDERAGVKFKDADLIDSPTGLEIAPS